MPTIENHTEHPFEYGRPSRRVQENDKLPPTTERVFKIERARATVDPAGNAIKVPGTATVTDELLVELQKDRIAKHWFGPTSLVVVPDRKPAEAKAR